VTAPGPSDGGWEKANSDFLSVSLRWLRLVLAQHGGCADSESGGVNEQPVAHRWGRGGSRRDAGDTRGTARHPTDADIAQALAAITDAESMTPRPALAELAAVLGLSRFERNVLLLCAAIELDPAAAALCAQVHGNEAIRYPTFGLALSALPDPAWDAISPERPLRFWRLVEISQRPGDGLIAAAIRADERIVNYIKGHNYLDDRLAPLVSRLDAAVALDLPPSQRAAADKLAGEWDLGPAAAPIVQLVGADDTAKRLVAAHAADTGGLVAFRLPATLLPSAPVELDNLARLWEREAALLPLALYLEVDDASDTAASGRPPLGRFLSRVSGRIALATRESWSDLGRQSVLLDVAPPTVAERAEAWRQALGPGADVATIDALSTQFALEASEIAEITLIAPDPDDAWRECRIRTRPRIDVLAQRLEPQVDWDDIVLPEEARTLLQRVADQMAHRALVYDRWQFGARITRGLGVSVLFAGPSGTGKTMAAEVLAARLQLDLYRIDLSAVVSKYIGETEKNLRRLFDAAEGGGAILFFDEADALFGKRSEVKDSHDRYANIEINYLLQQMEAYRGLAILATNMRGALDTAFLRRLRFIIEFAFPGVAERRAIWCKSFPASSPVGALDYERLAQLPVTGGMIRNIAVNAAFLAAAAGSDITMELVLAAARTEFDKLELPIREREFAVAAGQRS
jgi:hypothetical protein